MFIAKEILHNFLMNFPFVKNIAKKYHKTGMNENTFAVLEAIAFYQQYSDIKEKNILELGPGQTLGVLSEAVKLGAKKCSALDVCRYFDSEYAEKLNIDYRIYDGNIMPYPENQFDVIWSYDVLEHIRKPQLLINEVFRVLKTGGIFISKIDCRDHFYLFDKTKWLNCYKYSERIWNLMTLNRSNFINRLRRSDWEILAENVNFKEVKIVPYYEKSLLDLKKTLPNLKKMSDKDIKTFQVDLICKK